MGESLCCTAAPLAMQQPIFLSSSAACGAANVSARLQCRMLDSSPTRCPAVAPAAQQTFLLDCSGVCSTATRCCCPAAPPAAQQTILLDGSGVCWTASGFAVRERRLRRSKRFLRDYSGVCSAAARLAVQQRRLRRSKTILLDCSGVSWTASDFAVQHPPLLCRKRFCCVASAFPRQHLTLPSGIVYANFEATTTYTLCTTTYRLWSSPPSNASKFISYSHVRTGIRTIDRHGPCAIGQR